MRLEASQTLEPVKTFMDHGTNDTCKNTSVQSASVVWYSPGMTKAKAARGFWVPGPQNVYQHLDLETVNRRLQPKPTLRPK